MNLLPYTHFTFAFLLAKIAYAYGFITGYDGLIIGLIAVLIDLDHYIKHIMLKKSPWPIRFWNEAMRDKNISYRTALHRWQGMACVMILSAILLFFSTRFATILILSYFSHIFLDYLSNLFGRIEPHRVLHIGKIHLKWQISEHLILFVAIILLLYR